MKKQNRIKLLDLRWFKSLGNLQQGDTFYYEPIKECVHVEKILWSGTDKKLDKRRKCEITLIDKNYKNISVDIRYLFVPSKEEYASHWKNLDEQYKLYRIEEDKIEAEKKKIAAKKAERAKELRLLRKQRKYKNNVNHSKEFKSKQRKKTISNIKREVKKLLILLKP